MGLGNPVAFMLSAGNDHDSVYAVALLEKVDISGSNILADRAYVAKTIRVYISEQGASYVIPPQSNISEPWPVDWWLYKERHLIECFFQKLRWFRRIATRYDKLDASFLASLKFVAMNPKKLARWKTKRQLSVPFPPLSLYLSILHFAACLVPSRSGRFSTS